MKKQIFITILITIISISVYAQADNVVGYWLTEEGDSQIQIFKASNGKFYGKIVWMKDKKDIRDTKNSDPALKNRKVLGLQILANFMYDKDDKEWSDGKIYDPNNGNNYSCYMWFDGNKNMLKIKGYVMGMRFLGRETTWKRETNLRT